MSNMSSWKGWEQQVDRKVNLVTENPRIEPALPAPPPRSLDLSSSSSTVPPASHDPSHFNLHSAASSSSVDPIAAQFAQLFSIVSRLSSENEALKARVGHLSSTVSRLSSENESKEAFIRQVEAKVFPDGFWVWEKLGDVGGNGRWRWSRDKNSLLPSPLKSGPPTSFASLPVELLRLIFKFAGQQEQSCLTCLSFRLLEVFGPLLYATVELQTPESAFAFMEPRVSPPDSLASRVTPFLVLTELVIWHRPKRQADDLISEDEYEDEPFCALDLMLPKSRLPIEIPKLRIKSWELTQALVAFSPILLLLRPIDLILSFPSLTMAPPSFAEDFDLSSLPFLLSWTLLRSVTSIGFRSIFTTEEGSPWEGSFDEESRDAGLESWVRTEHRDGRTEESLVVDLKKTVDRLRPINLGLSVPPMISVVLKKKEVEGRGGDGI